ncbi:MAG: hypothetical protein ACRDIZ_12445 [Actinomycetota bacterium]
MAYAYQVLLAWILTGEVFGKCLAQGLRGLGAGDQPRMQRQDAEELAYDVVGQAVVAFRDRVLKPGRWAAEAGATLKTFFVGQVLIQFIPIYKSWLRRPAGRRTWWRWFPTDRMDRPWGECRRLPGGASCSDVTDRSPRHRVAASCRSRRHISSCAVLHDRLMTLVKV